MEMPRITRRRFLAGTLLTIGATGLYSHYLERHFIETTTIPLSLGLAKPLRIAATGDIHFDPLCEEEYLTKVMRTMTALEPDIIVYTGDFVTRSLTRISDLTKILAQATARHGVYAVWGNHDHWTAGVNPLTAAFEKNGIRVLRNASVPIPDQDNLFLTGLDSFWAGRPNLDLIMQGKSDSSHIVAIHEPDSFTKVRDPRIKLQISGHTHGGQVRVPWMGALRLPKWGQLYSDGLYSDKGRHLYVNRGAGTISPHFRFDCRPEISLFELT